MSRPLYTLASRSRISLIMTSIPTWYKTADFKLVARKLLTCLSVGLIVAPLYAIALFALRHFLNSWTGPAGIVTIVVMVFIFPWIMMALRNPVQKRLDQIFYGWRSPYRETMLSLPSRMRNTLSIGELAEELLHPIPRALNTSHVSLLLPQNGSFV